MLVFGAMQLVYLSNHGFTRVCVCVCVQALVRMCNCVLRACNRVFTLSKRARIYPHLSERMFTPALPA